MLFNPETLPSSFRDTHWDVWSQEQKDKWLRVRREAQLDAMYLACKVIGWDFQEKPHRTLFDQFFKIIHGEDGKPIPLYKLSPEIKKFLVLWPRGTFKTSSIVILMVLLIINYPDIRILIMQGSKDLAERQLARVKRIFEKHERFAQVFPEFCGENLGTTSHFSVPCQSAERPYAEPTVAISTAKSVKAGSHFDVIFVDDLVNDQNYKSERALAKCWDDYKDIGPLLEPSGYMIVTGTRYSFGDTYQLILESAQREIKNKGKSVWKFSIRACWDRFCATCGHSDVDHDFENNQRKPPCLTKDCACKAFADSGRKELLFPEVILKDERAVGHTFGFLDTEREEKGDEWFSCQYFCNPIMSGTQNFPPELIEQQTIYHQYDQRRAFIGHAQPCDNPCKDGTPACTMLPNPVTAPCFVVADLSYVGRKDRDKSVIYVVYLHKGQLFVTHCYAGKWNASEVCEQLFKITWHHRPRVMWVEAFLGWEAYDTVFKSYARDLGIQNLPLFWHKMSNEAGAKIARIGAVRGPLKQRRLWLYAGMENFDELCTQLKRWPKLGRHDDFADCLGLVCEVPSGWQNERATVAPDIPSFMKPDREPADEPFSDGGLGSGIICG